MAEVNTKEMVSVTKEEMMDVNMEDMADLDIPMMSQVNIDDLMADVAEVQTVLQCNNIGHTVDVNEIYEKLEELTYINREDRIEYVATQLIYKSGIIDEPNVAPEERVFRFSVQSNEDNLVENTSWSRGTVPEVSGSCDTRNQNDVPYSNVIDSAYSGSVTMHPHELCQNFINVPELVTVSQTVVGNQNQPDAGATVLDIDDGYCQESDMDAEAVVREAELIHSIFPQHDFEQIYACLRANKDSDTRVDDVTETFLQINAESGVAQLPYSEVAVTSGMNAKPVDIVHASPVSLCAPSVFPSSAPSNNDNVYHGRATSFDEKPCSNKYSVTSNAVFPQKTSTDADLRHTNVSNSEVTDKEGCQESTESRQIHIFNVGSYIENSHEIITEKLEVEAQCNEDELCEKTIQVTESSVEHKICEEGVEQRRCEESVDDMQLLVKQKVSAEVTPLYFGQKLSEESIDGTPLIVEQTVLEERIEATPLSVIQKVSEESVEVTLSRKDITHLAVSKSEDNMIDLTMCDAEESDTPSYASCRDLDMNVNILKEETDRCNSEHTHMHRDGPCFNADCEVKESHPSCDVYEIMQSDVELNDSDEDIGGTVPDFQMVFQESDTSKTETLETSVSDVHVECDVTAIAETGEQCSMSFESSCSGDLINFMDSLDGENEDDSTVAKLRELFPDARIDYLIKVSHEFGSLTDMANKVLESSENEENVVGDTLSEAGPSVSASLQKPPSQGCRKKEITYKEFESSLPHVDPVLLMEIWDGIGTDYNAVKEFIAQQTQENSNDSQYHMLLSLFPHADPAFLREKCNVIGSNEDSLKDFIEEQLQNKTDAQYHTLRAIFPQTDSAYLHEKCIEIGDDEIAMRAFVAEQLKENEGDDRYHTLLAMFPEKDPAFLREAVERIGDDEDAMKLFVTQQLEEVDGVKFQTLLAVLPDADPDYLHTTFEKIGNDEEAVKVFLLEALENKDYPTRETFLKRQEMTALRRKYKEEFSIEDFIEMFPDPRKHFYEESNNSSSELIRKHGIAYLETRYRNIALEDIITSFQKNGYNLTLTCRELDKWNGPMQLWRETFSCTVPNTEDIPASFLQEVCIFLFVIEMWVVLWHFCHLYQIIHDLNRLFT
jgi:hypothetical protein